MPLSSCVRRLIAVCITELNRCTHSSITDSFSLSWWIHRAGRQSSQWKPSSSSATRFLVSNYTFLLIRFESERACACERVYSQGARKWMKLLHFITFVIQFHFIDYGSVYSIVCPTFAFAFISMPTFQEWIGAHCVSAFPRSIESTYGWMVDNGSSE